jgi:hypothetical protein
LSNRSLPPPSSTSGRRRRSLPPLPPCLRSLHPEHRSKVRNLILPFVSRKPGRSTSRNSPTLRRPPRPPWCCRRHPGHLPEPLSQFASLPSSCRACSRAKPSPRAQVRPAPASRHRLRRAPPPSSMPAAAPSLVDDASRPIHRGRPRLNRGITLLARSTMDQWTQSMALVHGCDRRPIYDQRRRSRPAPVHPEPHRLICRKPPDVF